MSFINKAILRGYKAPRPRHPDSKIDSFTIKLHDGGSVIEGLTIDDAYDGPRDKMVLPAEHRKSGLGNLVEPGYVRFISPRGKAWPVRFNEFSFVFNHRKTEPEPKKPFTPSTPPDHYTPEALKEAA